MPAYRHAIRPTTGRSLLPSALAVAALSVGITSTASAQAVLQACYVPASGTVYRIKATNTPQNCLQPTHVAFSWTDGAEAAASLLNAVKKTDAAAGDVTGVFTNLTVGKLLGRALAATPPSEGQVLTWNATTNVWEPKTVAAGGGGSVSDHGALTGLSDDDHAQYLISNGVRSATGFALRSVVGANVQSPLVSTGNSYGGFMVLGSRGAVRAGQTGLDSDWSASQIGLGSASFGLEHVAVGIGSFAAGKANRAEGDFSTALGWNTQASGMSSFAAGQGAFATGQGSVAMGLSAYATGTGAVALGPGADASGVGSFSMSGKSSATSSVSFFGYASGTRSMALGYRANTNGKADAMVIALGDANIGSVNAAVDAQFVVSAPHIFLGHMAPPVATAGRFIETGTGAYLSSGGVWTNTSDSTKKTAFRAVDGEQILSKLAALPVYTWQYKAEDATTRHMGPTAQAFRKAFGLGDTNKAISTVDIDGVAIAGVKALDQRTRTLKTETVALRAENSELAARVAQLEALVAQLAAQSAGSSSRR